MKKVMGVLAIVLAMFVAGVADSFTRTREQIDVTGADGTVQMTGTIYEAAAAEGSAEEGQVYKGPMIPVFFPLSCTGFNEYVIFQGTSPGAWRSTGLGKSAYSKGSIAFSGDSGDNSSTKFLHVWNGKDVPAAGQDGVIISGPIVGNQEIVLDPLPLHYKVEIRESTSTVSVGSKLCL